MNRVDINNFDPEQVKEAIEESSSEELAGPFVLINYLSVVGSLSPWLVYSEPFLVWSKP